jgi:hypothetical protein
VPKCASTSIESVVKKYSTIKFGGEPAIKHMSAQYFHDYVLPLHRKLMPTSSLESFCMMREPLEWVNSWYRYRSREALSNPQHPNHANYTGNISFEGFVEALTSENPPAYADIKNQSYYIKLRDGRVGVDKIFPMERIEEVANYLSGMIDEEIEIPMKNVSPDRDKVLPTALYEKFKEFYREDYELYRRVQEKYTN